MPANGILEPATASFQLGHISPGDVVFVYSRPAQVKDRIFRFFNVTGQRILAAIRKRERIALWVRIPRYSHVMLGLGGGLIIHADGKTVKIEIVSDALRHASNEASLFQIYRRQNLTQDDSEKVVKAAMRYYNQKYSFFPYLAGSTTREQKQTVRSKEDTTQFCSRLVAHAYRSAGILLSSLPDNQTLPIDLFKMCQSEEWKDISSEFIQKPVSPEIDEAFGAFDVPGHDGITFSEFFKKTDELLRSSAELSKKRYEQVYSGTRLALHTEAMLAQFCSIQFDIAQQIHVTPSQLEDEFATRIVRVLEQLEALLACSLVPSIDVLLIETIINKVDDQHDNGLYAGFPPPVAIREMQKAREAITIYTYLLLAKVGLFSILAHCTSLEKLEQFRAVKREYARDFWVALRPVENLSIYDNTENLFQWVGEASDRTLCKTLVSNIVAALKIIEILRKSPEPSPN